MSRTANPEDPRTTHGLSYSVEYNAWRNAVARCHNVDHHAYKNYGARGIHVCDKWRYDVAAFCADIGKRPDGGYEIDRIDNNKGYEPGNVRWATVKENIRNRRVCKKYKYQGKDYLLTDLARMSGLSAQCLLFRLKSGWAVEKACTTPASVSNRNDPEKCRRKITKHWVEVDGRQITAREACATTGVEYGTAMKRLQYGWTVRQAVGLDTRC